MASEPSRFSEVGNRTSRATTSVMVIGLIVHSSPSLASGPSSFPPCRASRPGLRLPEGVIHASVPQEHLPYPPPDRVLDRRVVRVLGRDEGGLLRSLQQSPPPLGQRSRLCLGTGIP